MYMKFLKYFRKQDSETEKIKKSVDDRFIADAYESVKEDIESLRQYDRGEKTIHAPDLRNPVHRVQ